MLFIREFLAKSKIRSDGIIKTFHGIIKTFHGIIKTFHGIMKFLTE